MTVEAFGRLKNAVAIYCSACGKSHLAERCRLWLEAEDRPLGGPPPEATWNGVGGGPLVR